MNAQIDDPALGLRLPEGPVVGVVLVVPDPLGGPVERALAVHSQGLAVRTVAMPRVPEEADLEALLDATDDGAALAAIDAARIEVLGELGDVPVWLIGVGYGGTVAIMALGALPGLAGAVVFDPVLVWPRLDARHPAQPLDLLPGVVTPLQIHVGEPDGHSVRASHLEDLRARLGGRSVPWWLFAYERPRGFAGGDDACASLAWTRAKRLLPRGP